MTYEVWWSEQDYESESHTVLGRFDDSLEADELVQRLGGETKELFVKYPDEIVAPGPSAKWVVTRTQFGGDTIHATCPTGEESFRHEDIDHMVPLTAGETWRAEVYAQTKDEAIARFSEHFGIAWTGELKGVNKWMRDMSSFSTPFADRITMGGAPQTFHWVWSQTERQEGGSDDAPPIS